MVVCCSTDMLVLISIPVQFVLVNEVYKYRKRFWVYFAPRTGGRQGVSEEGRKRFLPACVLLHKKKPPGAIFFIDETD